MKNLRNKIILLVVGVIFSFSSIAQLPLPSGFYGNGSNGSIKVLDGATYYTDDVRAVVTGFVGPDVISIPISSVGSFKKDSIVLIIGMTNCEVTTRNWEFNKIKEVNETLLTLVYPVNIYLNPQIIQIKQFSDITINVGGVLTCHPWDGSTGGVISFMVNDSLKIHGLIEANGKGFETGIAGLGGTGGVGGMGGAGVGAFGLVNPGSLAGYDVLTHYGEGIGGAGNGATSGFGNPNDNTIATLPGICCGCLVHSQKASNLSALVSGIENQKRILMGGSGASGDGGIGGDGAGGSGGDSPLCNAAPFNGNAGGAGGSGGNGGLGGKGGGVVLFKAVTIAYDSLGKIQANGANGELGADGLNGGRGGIPNVGEGAGGGNGAGGGSAGSGGNAGASGIVYFIKANATAGTQIIKLSGGEGGAAGTSGAGGPPGEEAELGKNSNCPLTYSCACPEVWGMINGSSASIVSVTNNITTTTYTKSTSVCTATTEIGKLSVSCTDLTTGNIYNCEMQQVDVLDHSVVINNASPDICLNALSINEGPVLDGFSYCLIIFPNASPTLVFKATTCGGCGPGQTYLCACTEVWDMINGSVLTLPFDPNINTYTKPNSVCIATTQNGKLSVSCTNQTTGDIYKCEMQEINGMNQVINIDNPALCLSILSTNMGSVPGDFTNCTINCPPNSNPTSIFKATTCGCRHLSVEGPPGLSGVGGQPGDSMPYSEDEEPYNPNLVPMITYSGTLSICEGNSNGSIHIEITGGQPGYTITVTGPGGPYTSIGPVLFFDISNLSAGVYMVFVKDANNQDASATIIIISNPMRFVNGFNKIESCPVQFNSNIMLECFYQGSGIMNNCLFITGITLDPTDADYITISAMQATSPFGLVDEQQGILKIDGSVNVVFGPSVISGNSYYIKLNHRNSIETWSADPIQLTTSTYYSFSSSPSQAYLSNEDMTFDGIYAALFSGDLNHDGAVDATDFLILDPLLQNGAGGYLDEDLNGDGAVDGTDFLCLDINIQKGIGAAHP